MRTLPALLVSFVLWNAFPAHLHGQSVVGGFAGRTESRQLRDREEPSAWRSGLTLGGFVDVQTPVPFLGVLAEASIAQRGGAFDAPGGQGLRSEVESDVMAFTAAPKLRLGVGPVSVFLYGGPSVEIPLRTRSAPDLASAYRNPAGQIFAAVAGGGLGLRVAAWSVSVEARVAEELTNAYSGDGGDFRHRAREIVVRVGRAARR